MYWSTDPHSRTAVTYRRCLQRQFHAAIFRLPQRHGKYEKVATWTTWQSL